MTTNNLRRKAEKYHRLAYELEHDAGKLRKQGHDSIANTVSSMASLMGDLARHMDEKQT